MPWSGFGSYGKFGAKSGRPILRTPRSPPNNNVLKKCGPVRECSLGTPFGTQFMRSRVRYPNPGPHSMRSPRNTVRTEVFVGEDIRWTRGKGGLHKLLFCPHYPAPRPTWG